MPSPRSPAAPFPSAGPRLSAYYVAHFACTGVHLPFWSLWLASIGVSAEWTGVLLALGHGVSMGTSPLAGRIADRRGPRALMGPLAAVAVAGFALFHRARGVPSLAVLTLLTFGAHGALLPLAESISQRQAGAGRVRYGRVRLWGSLSFVAASTLAGALVERSGEGVIPWMLAAGAAGCWIASRGLPADEPGEDVRPGATATAVAWGPLVRVLALSSLVQASHAVYYGFGSLTWAAQGFGDTEIGALWALGVLAEVVFFAASPRFLSRTDPVSLVLAGAAFATARWVLLAHVRGGPGVSVLQTLHAVSFGATHLGTMEFVRRHVPASRLAAVQGIYTAVAGASYALVTPFAGALFARYASGAYLGAAGLAAASTLAGWVLAPRARHAAADA